MMDTRRFPPTDPTEPPSVAVEGVDLAEGDADTHGAVDDNARRQAFPENVGLVKRDDAAGGSDVDLTTGPQLDEAAQAG